MYIAPLAPYMMVVADDPELRHTEGTAIMRFSVWHTYVDKDGWRALQSDPDLPPMHCTIWGDTAEQAMASLRRGQGITVHATWRIAHDELDAVAIEISPVIPVVPLDSTCRRFDKYAPAEWHTATLAPAETTVHTAAPRDAT